MLIEDVHARVCNRAANGDRFLDPVGLSDRIATCEGRVLRGPICVNELAALQLLERPKDMRNRQDVAAYQELTQKFQVGKMLIDHRMKEARRQPKCCDLIVSNVLADLVERGDVGRGNHELASVE